MKRAVDVVRKIAPKARAEYVAAFDHGDQQLKDAGIDTPLRLAHLLAQCGGECNFKLTRESLDYTTVTQLTKIFGNIRHTRDLLPGEAKMLLRQEHDIGERFYGVGGPSKLYADNGINKGVNPGNPNKAKSLGNDRPGDGFLFRGNGMLQTTGGAAHREVGKHVGVDFFNHPELLTSAEHALKPVLFEWTASKCNTFADKDDVLKISKAVNLGNPNSKATPNGLKDRKEWLKRAKAALGI